MGKFSKPRTSQRSQDETIVLPQIPAAEPEAPEVPGMEFDIPGFQEEQDVYEMTPPASGRNGVLFHTKAYPSICFAKAA